MGYLCNYFERKPDGNDDPCRYHRKGLERLICTLGETQTHCLELQKKHGDRSRQDEKSAKYRALDRKYIGSVSGFL